MNRIACVTAILQNSRGHVLLQQRDEKPDLAFPGFWTTLGGRVEADESPVEAIRRELQEEIGLNIPVRQWKVYERQMGDLSIEQYVFVGQIDNAVSDLVLTEGQGLNYFAGENLTTLPIAFGFDILLADYFAQNMRSTNDY